MFDSFSKHYESVYRTIITIWIIIWSIINGGVFLYSLATYSTIRDNSNEVGRWFFDSLSSLIGIGIGILLLILLNNAYSSIRKTKPVKTSNLILSLGILYFLLPSFTSLLGVSLFNPNDFIKDIPFIVIWLIPSLGLLVAHIFYSMNIGVYNESLQTSSTDTPDKSE